MRPLRVRGRNRVHTDIPSEPRRSLLLLKGADLMSANKKINGVQTSLKHEGGRLIFEIYLKKKTSLVQR